MSILRPILTPPFRPVSLAVPMPGTAKEETILYLLGEDGLLILVDSAAQAGTIVEIDDTGAAIAITTTDVSVVSETAETVTLEFGD